MFSERMATEEMSKSVYDKIFQRVQEDAEALEKLRQSNPSAVPSAGDSFSSGNSSMFSKNETREDLSKSLVDRIFERVEQDRVALLKFSSTAASHEETQPTASNRR